VAAVAFDLDGVVADSSEAHYRAWKRLADEEGIPFDRGRNDALRGVSRQASLDLVLDGRKVADVDRSRMLERKNAYYLELLRDPGPELLEGAERAVASARARRLRVGVVSSSRNAAVVIDALGIGGWFDDVTDGSAAFRSKPAPDLFLVAAERLGCAPDELLVVEDAAAGVTAALAAGCVVVGVGPEDRVGAAQHRFASTAELDLDAVLDRYDVTATGGADPTT
jgi:beta-phosphoglucomutase